MGESLSDKSAFVLTGKQLAELERIVEFGVVAYFVWLISESVPDSLTKANLLLAK